MGKKILFFDSWKGGIHNFYRLNDALYERGFQSLLVHLGSWGNEEETIKEEIIGGLLTRDISFYNGIGFEKILEIEKPDAVLFLSIHTFAHRAFIRYCKKACIPTILLYHGFVRVQDVDDNTKGAYKVNFFSYAKRIIERIPKLVQYTMPCYIKSLICTESTRKDWIFLIKNIVYAFTRPTIFNISPDAKTSLCLIYASADRVHAKNVYSFSDEQIKEVGNPDFTSFSLNEADIASNLNVGLNDGEYVMYIDTALLVTGLFFKSEKEYMEHLEELAKEVKKMGKTMLFKPHPETARLCDLSQIDLDLIKIVDKHNFVAMLKRTICVITEPTTLSIIPCTMGIPLLLAKYNRLSELRFGHVLRTYPRVAYLEELATLDVTIKKILSTTDSESLEQWVSLNVGPLPANEMPARVVKYTESIIKQY